MKKKKTHYEVLGVPRDADLGAIKKAFRKLSLEWHPDKHPGDEAVERKYKTITTAYGVLSDAERRRSYDVGFDEGGTFDPTNIDPSLLDPEKFIETFVGLFGDYLDARIPGGFRTRVTRATERVQEASKKKRKKKSKKKAKKKAQKTRTACTVCQGEERIALQQGSFTVYVSCRACAAKKAS